MSLKKDENRVINFKLFKIFVKTKKQYIKLWHPKKEEKVFLIFILLKIAIEKEEKFCKLKNNYLKQLYLDYFNTDCSCKKTVKILEHSIENNIKDIDMKKLNVNHFYNNLYSFYENSKILNIFWKKEKKKNISIDIHGVNNYILLNKNLKAILVFIKEVVPEKFNFIYKKILILS